MSAELDGSTDAQFASLIDRILRLREEADERMADVREIYAEAKGLGFDKTLMGKLVAELRKQAKDGDKAESDEAILDLYRQVYSRAHRREAASEAPSWDAARNAARAA